MRPFIIIVILSAFSTASAAPKSFTYLLQADARHQTKAAAVYALRESGRDWFVLDPTFGGADDERWTAADLSAIRAQHPERRILAYLSIGEAEDYRPYWQPTWKKHPPTWLREENPDWKGNFKIAYWRDEWQRLILPEVDRILAAGFDGLYFDIVDGFEHFEQEGKKYLDHRPNPDTGRTYREDMIAWVTRLARHARRARPDCLIIPQNAAQLLESAGYRQTISGIGIEDLFTNGKKPKRPAETEYILAYLKTLSPTGKPVLIIDYAKSPDLADQARQSSRHHKFIHLNTDRPLKTLGTP